MFDALIQLSLFSAKAIILVILLLLFVAGLLALLSRGKDKLHGKINIQNLNKKYSETTDTLLAEIHSSKQHKQFLKQKKKAEKLAADESKKNVFVVNFIGDIKASAVEALREEVTAILGIAKPQDEVVVCLESGGGMVHTYGLATAQLSRIREQQIPLTIAVDKIAASGGYMMASIANKIIAAPFAIIGSIGVIVQLPNFHRLLQEKHVDFEQLTAGNYKRTLTVFGQNTEEGREKLRQEIEEIHYLFKNLIKDNRPIIDIEEVATGEHWLAKKAIEYKLVDELKTSDDYLYSLSKTANIYEISYKTKKSFLAKLTSSANIFKRDVVDNIGVFTR